MRHASRAIGWELCRTVSRWTTHDPPTRARARAASDRVGMAALAEEAQSIMGQTRDSDTRVVSGRLGTGETGQSKCSRWDEGFAVAWSAASVGSPDSSPDRFFDTL